MRLLLTAVLWLLASQAAAQSVRAIVLTKEVRDGKLVSQGGLDAAATAALKDKGLRLLDLDAALRGQRFALSDAVQSGKVPDELTVLNADAAVSVQLRCRKSTGSVMGTAIMAYHCGLDTKVIRVDSGDVIYAKSESLAGHGRNPEMAVQSVLAKQLPTALHGGADSWLASFTVSDTWEVDLSVAEVSDRQTARAIAERVSELPGVNGARLIVWSRGLAKIAVSGGGRGELEGLSGALESHPGLALTVTYESQRVLHAQFDFAKAYRRQVMVMSVVPRDAAFEQVASHLTREAMANLPYLEMAHTRPLTARPDQARKLEQRLRDKAQSLGVPLLLVSTLSRSGEGWQSALRLVDVQSRRTLATATAQGPEGVRALDAVVRRFDSQYRTTLGRAEVRQQLGLGDGAAALAADQRLVINAFRLPAVGRTVPKGTHGSLVLRNASADPIEGAQLTLATAGRKIDAQQLPTLAPGQELELGVPLEGIPLSGGGYVSVTAEVVYKVEDTYRRVNAVAPVVRKALALDRVRGARASKARQGKQPPEDYVSHFQAAVAKRNDGQWQEARELFLKAHAIYPTARSFRALGMVEYDLRNYQTAKQFLGRALKASRRALTPQQRVEVEELLARASRPGLI